VTAGRDDARMRGGRRVKTRTGNSNRDYNANLLAVLRELERVVKRWVARLSGELVGYTLLALALLVALLAGWIAA
jgi:hypothetical protein